MRDYNTAVVYLRTSTKRQNIKMQCAVIEAFAENNGITIHSCHFDIGRSGSLPVEKRFGLLWALDTLQESNVGLLLVRERGRLARDQEVADSIDRMLKHMNVKLRVSNEHLETEFASLLERETKKYLSSQR